MLRELLALCNPDAPVFAMQAGRPLAFGAPMIERRRYSDGAQFDGYAINVESAPVEKIAPLGPPLSSPHEMNPGVPFDCPTCRIRHSGACKVRP
jgi:hypothetical protein